MIKVATVCTGIGSPEKALENLGIPHEIVFGCEIDKYARQTYLANFNPGFMEPDMTKCDWEGKQYYSDLFIGGIPCQAFSLAGKRLGELDPRGLLFYDFYRYVKVQQPKYFIIENVKGLLSDNNGQTFQNWINLLGQSVNGDQFMFPHEDSLMYNLHWQVLNTKDYGIPQNRERVFLVGIRNDLPNDFVFPKPIPLKLRLKDILEDEVDEKYYLSEKMLNYFNTRADNFNNGKINFKDENDIASFINASSKSLDISDNIIKEKHFDRKFEPKTEEYIANCVTARYAKMAITDNYLKVENIGNTNPSGNGMNGNVFSSDGLSPTLTTNKGEGVKVKVPSATRSVGVKVYQKPRGANKGGFHEIAPTLTSNSFQENNLMVEQQIIGYTRDGNGKVVKRHLKDEAGTLTLASGGGGNTDQFVLQSDYRIRKLTTKECFRLQGFPDEFHDKAVAAGVSNSQLYKQAGNSITVNVIQAILKNLLKEYL